MDKICVTGGAGFIGSHIVHRLLDAGYEVVVIDNLRSGDRGNVPEEDEIEFIKASVLDSDSVDFLEGVDAVFHHAAIVGVRESRKIPLLTFETNVAGTLNILKACVENGVDKLVFASSSAIYEETRDPIKEDAKISPDSPYASSKVVAESLIEYFNKTFELETIVLRYFNVFGPRQNLKYTAAVTEFISNALDGRDLVIHGDGKQTRDFVFIEDVVDSNILALENKGVFNIGSGKSISILELAEKVIELTNSDSGITYGKPREDDKKYSLADIGRAERALGFKPEYDLERGLKETIEWFKSNRM